MCAYLVKEAVDLCECVCNWQVQELGKLLQTQSVSVQLSGSSCLLLQPFVCGSCSQPVDKILQEKKITKRLKPIKPDVALLWDCLSSTY